MDAANSSKNINDDDEFHQDVNSTIKRFATATSNQSKSNNSHNQQRHHHHHHHQIPAIFKLLRQPRLKEAIRRDVVFLLAGALAACIVGYIETHASDDEIRFRDVVTRSSGSSSSSPSSSPSSSSSSLASSTFSSIENDVCVANHERSSTTQNSMRILDAGFILTTPIYTYLASHRHVNDYLAMGNSILLTLPFLYCIYVTLWKGDFRLSFRLIATHLFRSLCGWFTYLPPDPEFLSSSYDFPEIFLCLFQECSSKNNAEEVNFLTFFSGHVATIAIVANHLYMSKHTHLSIALHAFNWLQAIRLLATRGHYSIDLIIGYVVSVFVLSSPAERLGLYYSRGIQPTLPNIVETFEILVGVGVAELSGGSNDNNINNKSKNEDGHHCENREDESMTVSQQSTVVRADNGSGMSSGSHHNGGLYDDVRSETSVRIAVDIVTNIAQMKIASKNEQ